MTVSSHFISFPPIQLQVSELQLRVRQRFSEALSLRASNAAARHSLEEKEAAVQADVGEVSAALATAQRDLDEHVGRVETK